MLLITAAALAVSSCGNTVAGYAVILWPEQDMALQPGEVVEMIGESEAQQTVTIPDGNDGQVISMWRVARFETEAAAEEYAAAYAPWVESYARSLRTALPVRERADRTSTRVYRLRDGEVVKILSRLDEQSDEAGLVDYWYEVLTQEGIIGWVFGYYLELTGSSGRPLDPRDDQDRAERLMRDIATIEWRPTYFEEMINTGRVALDRFTPRFGLFGAPDENSFRIVLEDLDRSFEYTGVTAVDRTTIRLDNTSLELSLTGDRELTARYLVNGRQETTTFVRLETDIAEVIAAERSRRAQLLDQIVARGSLLVSTAFGTMELSPSGSIVWSGYERLIPSVLPESFTGATSLAFSLYLADELRGRYTGGVRMPVGGGRSIALLYTLIDDGIRFTFVPDALIEDGNIISAEPISPIVMFYRFSQN